MSRTKAWWFETSEEQQYPEAFFDQKSRSEEIARLNKKLAAGIDDPKELVETVRRIRQLYGIKSS